MSFNCLLMTNQLRFVFRLAECFHNIGLLFRRQIVPEVSGFSFYFGRNDSKIMAQGFLIVYLINQVVELVFDFFKL